MDSSRLNALAKDLTQTFPRSPREKLADYVHAARMLDKCRAALAGCAGEYHYDCPLDRYFFDCTGIDSTAFKTYVATGATDDEVAAWITAHSQVKERAEIVAWNNRMRSLRVCDLPADLQLFLEDYIPKFIPPNRPVRVWFDVYDLEEKRM